MYHALYRKYRPNDFDTVVGQDSIIKTLKNSIKNKNFSHAYMFFGPRGTGKTTVSKIFARNVNCLSPIDGIACKECDNCKISFSSECIDIIEIDAASNNGVEEIRELKNKISLVPSDLKYKIYIVDEVHMLSIGAFNALLKTLEEPPEHVIFILATTDPQKVPDTIISRCQCYNFKRISTDIISSRLKTVCNQESILIDDDVLYNIALFSDGGLRDALGLLDKLVSYSADKITMNDFIEINGIITSNDLNEFLKFVFEGNVSKILEKISFFDNSGKNLIQIMIQLLDFSRNLLVDYYLNNKKLDFSLKKLQILANLLNEKMFDIKKASNIRIYMEMFFLKFINDYIVVSEDSNINSSTTNIISSNDIVNNNVNNGSVNSEINKQQIKNDNIVNIPNTIGDQNNISSKDNSVSNENNKEIKKVVTNINEIISVRVHNTLAFASKDLLNKELKLFETLNDYTFDLNFGYLVCTLLDSKLRVVSSQSIIISFEFDSIVKQNLLIIDKLTEVYNKITNSSKKIAIISDAEWNNVKNKYISDLKNGIKYEFKEEPKELFEENDNSDIITSKAKNLFGNIVDVE